MSDAPNTKLCWNCDARVSPYEENCSCCCVYLHPLPKPKGAEESAPEAEAPPPYRMVEEEPHIPPSSPYPEPTATSTEEAALPIEKDSNTLLPMILLLMGSVFLLFSISLYFFSVDGVLTLKWNGEYWYLFLASAIPLLFFGWRSLSR